MTLTAADSLEILQLVTRADSCASARDADGYAVLFTDDAVMDGAMGDAQGRTAIGETVAAVWAREPAGTLHLTLNAVIENSEPEPSVEHVMLMVSGGSPPGLLGFARVSQTVRRTRDGWRISARHIGGARHQD